MDSFVNWVHSLFNEVEFNELILYNTLYNEKNLNGDQKYNLIKIYYKYCENNCKNNCDIITGRIKKYKIINAYDNNYIIIFSIDNKSLNQIHIMCGNKTNKLRKKFIKYYNDKTKLNITSSYVYKNIVMIYKIK